MVFLSSFGFGKKNSVSNKSFRHHLTKHYLTNYKTLSDKLQRLQNRAVHVLTNTCYDADANQLLKELGWDNLETRHQKLKAEMVYKSLNGLAPNYLSSRFIQRSDVITAYNLRDSDGKLAIPLPRTNYYKNSFGYSGAVRWNSLPSAARQATSLTSFR